MTTSCEFPIRLNCSKIIFEKNICQKKITTTARKPCSRLSGHNTNPETFSSYFTTFSTFNQIN